MKHFLIYLAILFLVPMLLCLSCRKETDRSNCPKSDVTEFDQDIYFGRMICTKENDKFERIYTNTSEFRNDTSCLRGGRPIALEFGYEGIVLAQGLTVPYSSDSGSAYEQSVEISLDTCSERVDVDYILKNIDTSNRKITGVSVLIFLNGIDSTYTVNQTHTIIPFGG